MNRLLLTAATALGMAVSSHAMAVTYTLDSFEGGNSLYGGADPFSNLLILNPTDPDAPTAASTTDGSLASYTSDGFTFSRSILLDQTVSTASTSQTIFAISGVDQEEAPTHYASLYLENAPEVNSVVRLTYDISDIDATVGANQASFNFKVVSTEAGTNQEVYIDAFLNGSATAFDTWTLSSPVDFYAQQQANHSFNVLGSSLTGSSDQLTFVIRGAAGYNLQLAPVTFDVLPVPEVGLLPMFGSGLLVVGFAARRKRRAVQSA